MKFFFIMKRKKRGQNSLKNIMKNNGKNWLSMKEKLKNMGTPFKQYNYLLMNKPRGMRT